MPTPQSISSKYCRTCDYPLDNQRSRQCSECGTPFDPDDPDTYSPLPKAANRDSWISRNLWTIVLVVYVVIFVRMIQSGRTLDWSDYLIMGCALTGIIFWLDRRHFYRTIDRMHRLEGALEYDPLFEVYRLVRQSWRPLFLIVGTLSARGVFEANLAVHLYNAGRLDRALTTADLAIKRSWRGAIRLAALDIRIKILTAMARYDEARTAIEHLAAQPAGDILATVNLASLEGSLGRLEAELAAANRALEDPGNVQANTARLVAFHALHLLDRHDQALEIVSAPFIDGVRLMDDKRIANLTRTKEGRRQMDHMRRNYAATIVPSLRHAIALILLERQDWLAMDAALAEAATYMDPAGTHPLIRLSHAGLFALAAAGNHTNPLPAAGSTDPAAARNHLEVMWHIANKVGSPALRLLALQYEAHTAILLHEPAKALTLFEQALAQSIHPIDRHKNQYRIAESALTAGDHNKARAAFEAVIADGIESHLRGKAMEGLGEVGEAWPHVE